MTDRLWPVMGAKDGDNVLAPLSLATEICETPENVRANLVSTLSKPYNPFTKRLLTKGGSVVSICGSGPSLRREFYKTKGDVLACNAAHDFMVRNGRKPDFGMVWDADKVVNKFITPTDGVEYFLASRCHPDVFERFAGFNVTVWHAGGDECLPDLLDEYNKPEPIINGGSAAVVRGMFLAAAMGYREMHIFGADSSYEGEASHFQKSVVPEEALNVYCLGKWFKTTPWLAVQVEDFKLIGPALRDGGVKIVIYGDGLLPHVARELGLEVHNEHDEQLADFYGPDFASKQLGQLSTT
jgi:hypothetical protein